MGLKLSPIITKKQITFDTLKTKRIAIDASNMLYQFLSSIRQPDGTPLMDSNHNITSHLVGTFSRLSNLITKNIFLCVCFDGKPPTLKTKTQEKRKLRKQIAQEKLKKAIAQEDIEAICKYSRQITHLTKEMVQETKELLKAMGLPVISAPSEADAQISFLAEKEDVWAACTTDIDPLLYNCPRILTNLTLSQRRKLPSGIYVRTTPELIELKQVLKILQITQDQLIIIAILTGTDYNQGIKGIGPKTALKLVKQYKNFDTLFKKLKPDFNWKQIYAIFKSMPIMKNYQLKWKPINKEKILEILVEKHDFNKQKVLKTLENLEKATKQKNLTDFT